MASRLPVVCSITSSYVPILRNENISLTFDSNDMEGLFGSVERLYLDNQLRTTLAQNAMIEAAV
jgi:hypothetical protein